MFQGVYGEIERLIGVELRQTPMARSIARKAGIKQGVALGLPQVLATFSTVNSGAPPGYEITYTTTTPFPNASITADLTDYSRLRLIANVVAGGDEGVVLTSSASGVGVSVPVPLAVVGLSVGTWVAVNVEGIATLTFTITAPVGGDVTLGLVQLQGV